ncbi:hypothetical protein [Gracilinema caldarium]|uniref:Uncharacterized protein n=1 Tax=Gracilinema caldarium (strain ATCC 51460 / DSM 7334 / H1) TaxID=744872 RepID=F8F4A4_GRAC1|nr:hypothetical protein [Gracilinema caldarium]AEJ20551.1 hypothetical protein Spica_2443 [Gracilinema caldarium DSM 7334]
MHEVPWAREQSGFLQVYRVGVDETRQREQIEVKDLNKIIISWFKNPENLTIKTGYAYRLLTGSLVS